MVDYVKADVYCFGQSQGAAKVVCILYAEKNGND